MGKRYLTKCKDCGHEVSTRAKTCPNCGVRKPGKPVQRKSTFGELLMIALVLFIGGIWITNKLGKVDPTSVASGQAQTAQARQPRVYTDAQIQEAIAKSDDYSQYGAEFTEAAKTLLTSRRCGRFELKEHGGFVRSPTYKDRPVYFTYCGGSTVVNRIYLDVSTGELFK